MPSTSLLSEQQAKGTRRQPLTGTVGLCHLMGGIGADGGDGTRGPSRDASGAGLNLTPRLVWGRWGRACGTGTLLSTAALFKGCTKAASFLLAASSSFFMLLKITMDLFCLFRTGLAVLWTLLSGEGSSKPGDVFGLVW